MELKIYNPSSEGFIKSIDWNHEEIKKEVAEKISYYASLVYTEDQIKSAKTDRATLNKFVQALEGKRKEIKKQCLAPYETFEKQMKEIIAIVNEPINLIDSQIKGFEERQKEEKHAAIEAYFNNCTLPFDTLQLSHIFDSKWLNASVNIKNVCKEINARLEQIEADLSTLANLPDFSFEATEAYKQSLNLNEAISEGQKLLQMQQMKAQMQAEKEEKVVVETLTPPEAEKTLLPPEDRGKKWVSFKAFMTVEQALMLKNFFDSNNIKFTSI